MQAHYAEHKERPFFERVTRFLTSGPVVAMVWEGMNVIASSRAMMGKTDPHQCAPGTIRGDYGAHFRRNLIHGSDSSENAAHEIGLWFGGEEVIEWDQQVANWVYEMPNSPTEFPEGADGPDSHPGHLNGKPGHVNQELAFKPTY